MAMNVVVTLTWAEAHLAVTEGCTRRLRGLQKSMAERHGAAGRGDAWGLNIEGAAAEYAAAKALNVCWSFAPGPGYDGDIGHGFEVRSTPREDGRLILHESDPDDRPFLLVTGQIPTFTIRGWIMAGDAKKDYFWRDDVPEPAYFVPQSALAKIGEPGKLKAAA